MKTAKVELNWKGVTFAFPPVEVSDAPNVKDRREENELHAMRLIALILPYVEGLTKEPPQIAFLLATTAVVSAQYGERDQLAEDETMQRYIKHYGFPWPMPPDMQQPSTDMITIGKETMPVEILALRAFGLLTDEEKDKIVEVDEERLVGLLQRKTSFVTIEDAVAWMRVCLAEMTQN